MKVLIKTSFFVWLCLACSVVAGAAQTRYISEEFEVPMRSGQSLEHRIVALIPSGRTVELVQHGTEWSQVRMSNGREGWILTRYLTDVMPSAMQLARLESRHAEVASRNKELQEKTAELASENKRLGDLLKQAQSDLAKIEAAHEALKLESAEYLQLKTDYENSRQELEATRVQADQFESALNQIANSQLYQGLLYGGGLVIFGFVAGFILKKPKRRGPLM